MKVSESQKRASKKYEADKIDAIRIRVPKGMREKIKKHAAKNGESANEMINRLIQDELSKK